MKNRLFKREGQTEQSCHRAGLLGNWPAPLWSFSSLFFFWTIRSAGSSVGTMETAATSLDHDAIHFSQHADRLSWTGNTGTRPVLLLTSRGQKPRRGGESQSWWLIAIQPGFPSSQAAERARGEGVLQLVGQMETSSAKLTNTSDN